MGPEGDGVGKGEGELPSRYGNNVVVELADVLSRAGLAAS